MRNVSAQDIITGKARLPFHSRSAWHAIQAESSDLRRTRAHLLQGTRKITNVQDVKRCLKVTSLASDGLVVVKRAEHFETECKVVPREVLHGIQTSLRI